MDANFLTVSHDSFVPLSSNLTTAAKLSPTISPNFAQFYPHPETYHNQDLLGGLTDWRGNVSYKPIDSLLTGFLVTDIGVHLLPTLILVSQPYRGMPARPTPRLDTHPIPILRTRTPSVNPLPP